MNIGFQTDPVENFNFETDSTLPIIRESQNRNNKNYVFLPNSLTYKNNKVYGEITEVKFKNRHLNSLELIKTRHACLDIFDKIFIRQDPPYNMEYISSLHILEQCKQKIKFINSPVGIRNAPEKISMLQFKEIIPPTIITRSVSEIKKFTSLYSKSIIKPLYGNGGESIFMLDIKDKNYNQIIEKFLKSNKEPFIIQKFLKEIKNGDKRIILVDGEPIAAVKRIPKKGEIRSNIHVGGECEKVELSINDKKICKRISGYLKSEGLFFVGIDIIDNYLTEINVTSPTCIQEIRKLHKIDIAKIIWDKM